MWIGIDGRAVQPGYKMHAARGIGSYARGLLGALPRVAGGNRLMVLFDDRYPHPDPPPASVEHARYRLPAASLLGRPIFANRFFLRSALNRFPTDALFFPFHEDAPPRPLRQPVVVVVHDCIPYLRPGFYRTDPIRTTLARTHAKQVLGYARIVTISESTKEDIVGLFDVAPDAITVVPPGLDPSFAPPRSEDVEHFRREKGLARPYVLTLGGSDPRKNNARVVRAWTMGLGELRAACDLLIVGPRGSHGWERPLALSIKEAGSPASIRRLESVSAEELPLLYAGARALLFVSLYEGFGLPPLEAMGCGTPVIASNTSSVPEVTGDAALLVDPLREEEIAHALGEVLGDSERRARMARLGRERAARFDWGESARRILEILHDEAERGQRR